MKDEWHQSHVAHCPDHNCKGMLLQNPFYHEEKCSKCGKYWLQISKYIEVEKPKKEVFKNEKEI